MTAPSGEIPPEIEERRVVALDMIETVTGLMARLQSQLNRLNRRSRIQTAVIVVLLVLGVVVGVALNNSSHAAADAHNEVVARCEAGNVSKAQQKQLWVTTVQALEAGDPPATSAGVATYAHEFELINKTFAPSDCQHIITSASNAP
jgi:hypothetical protein